MYTHFVGTYDGTTLTLYANGALVGAPTPMATGLLDSTGARAVIGAYPAGATPAFARALIDEVAVYDHVLPLERIQLHHAIGSLGPQPL